MDNNILDEDEPLYLGLPESISFDEDEDLLQLADDLDEDEWKTANYVFQT